MADTEKITINISVVDLGRIDLLVDQGFYSTRTDAIRTAIRNQLGSHRRDIEEATSRRAIVAGALVYDTNDLEEIRNQNEKLNIRVMGLLVIAKDVTPQLALDTIESINIFGVFKASNEVKAALKDRIK